MMVDLVVVVVAVAAWWCRFCCCPISMSSSAELVSPVDAADDLTGIELFGSAMTMDLDFDFDSLVSFFSFTPSIVLSFPLGWCSFVLLLLLSDGCGIFQLFLSDCVSVFE